MNGYTSGKISHDPYPYRFRGGRFGFPEGVDPEEGDVYDPRPEFDNHNPILVEFRDDPYLTTPERARDYLIYLVQHRGHVCRRFSERHIEHARRVLSKLAALS